MFVYSLRLSDPIHNNEKNAHDGYTANGFIWSTLIPFASDIN
jgi:hypothetical protein